MATRFTAARPLHPKTLSGTAYRSSEHTRRPSFAPAPSQRTPHPDPPTVPPIHHGYALDTAAHRGHPDQPSRPDSPRSAPPRRSSGEPCRRTSPGPDLTPNWPVRDRPTIPLKTTRHPDRRPGDPPHRTTRHASAEHGATHHRTPRTRPGAGAHRTPEATPRPQVHHSTATPRRQSARGERPDAQRSVPPAGRPLRPPLAHPPRDPTTHAIRPR